MAAPHGEDSASAFPLCDTRTGRVFTVRPQPSDIDACVPLSLLRCLLSITGIILVLTDIPRTGLVIDVFANIPKAAPGVAMYYGPYAYPVVHLNRSSCFPSNGSCDELDVSAYTDDDKIDSVELWSYKFDSLSIPTRALAEHLNVSSYPRCLLYEKPCRASTLAPNVVFSMLSDLMAAIHLRYFANASVRSIPLVFETINAWADRLHHMIIGSAGYRIDRRIHSVHYFSTRHSLNGGEHLGVDVCQARTATDRNRPMVCSLTFRWWADHPTLGAATQIPIEDGISLRFAALQQKYPDSRLEMAIITTRSLIHSRRVAFFPTVYYVSDNVEVTTLINGSRCLPGQPCRVEFVDDYRYERATVETSSEEIKFITGTLRAVSQAYVWVRVVLLLFISFQARVSEGQHRSKSMIQKFVVILLTFVRVPSHIIIYGSWLPLLAYSIAHFMDCGLVHLISENFWATANGFFDFKLLDFIIVASIQMRNIWLIALVWKCVTTCFAAIFTNRNRKWRPRDGLLAFRGVFIGMISFLTIFSFLRSLRFRNAKVTSFSETPRQFGFANQLFPPLSSGVSDFGHFLDLKVSLAASVIVCGAASMVQVLLRFLHTSPTQFFTCHNFYVPLSAGKLYPVSALNVFWYIQLAPRPTRSGVMATPLSIPRRLRSMSTKVLAAIIPLHLLQARSRRCEVCDFVSSPLHWRTQQGCPSHETLFTPGARSVETQSMIRLVNIGMLSDPIVFIRLRVFGRRLFLYRIQHNLPARFERRTSTGGLLDGPHAASLDPPAFTALNSYILMPSLLAQQDAKGDTGYDLVAVVDSRLVPWPLLVDCG